MEENRVLTGSLFWEFLKIKDDTLTIEFRSFFHMALAGGFQYYLETNEGKLFECHVESKRIVQGTLTEERTFRAVIDHISVHNLLKCKLVVRVTEDEFREVLTSQIGKFFPVCTRLKESYAIVDGWLVKFIGNELILQKNGDQHQTKQEERFIEELRKLGTQGAESATEDKCPQDNIDSIWKIVCESSLKTIDEGIERCK